MQNSVTITPDSKDTHTATVTAVAGAAPGAVTIQANIGGYTKTIALSLTSAQDSVKFTQSSSSVAIPLGDTDTTAQYSAVVIDGNGNEIADKAAAITYAVYDKDNNAEYTLPAGISFENGVLTVSNTAAASVFTIRATGQNSNGDEISRAIKVTVHGLKFQFGSADIVPNAGYTAVSPGTTYTSERGYGISSGSPTAAEGYLDGAMTFMADVEKGRYYTVEVTYQGTLKTAYINSDLAGYKLGANTTMATVSYTVAATRDFIDLSISSDGDTAGQIAAVSITPQENRTPDKKPNIYHVGDSTAANNGSWAYYIDHNRSRFPELDALVTFHNSGAGGRNLGSYYTQGKLSGVLNSIKPGDIVMFGNNGTNGTGSHFEEDVNYYLDAAEAMGAKIIINSYTPHGAVGSYASGYDSTTHTFDSYRKDGYDNTVRKIAAERAENDPNYLGFVEIGKNADAAFNAYVADYAANGYDSADAAAQAIIACFSDHNHYSSGSAARDLMLNGYGDTKGIAAQLVDILSGWTVTPGEVYTEKVNDTVATGWMPTVTNISRAGRSLSKINVSVTSENITKSFTAVSGEDFTELTLDPNSSVRLGIIISGLNDPNASLSVTVE